MSSSGRVSKKSAKARAAEESDDEPDADSPPKKRTKRASRKARDAAESDSGDDNDATDAKSASAAGGGGGGGAASAAAEIYEPVSDGSEIAFELKKLNSHLVCILCKGYLRDAHSIMECLHTFCKVCLYNYYHARTNPDMDSDCPKCHINLSSTDPMRYRVRSDRVLQNLVDKILPDFAQKDELLKRQMFGPKPTAAAAAAAAAATPATAAAATPSAADGKTDSAAAAAPTSASAGTNPYSPLPATSKSDVRLSPLNLPAAAAPAAAATPTAAGSNPPAIALPPAAEAVPELLLELQPTKNGDKTLGVLEKSFLRTSIKSTVRQVRRYVTNQLKLPAEVELLIGMEVLGVDHTLEFIKKTRWHHSVVSHGARHLMFTYRVAKK